MTWKKIFGMFGLNWLLKDIWYRMDWRKPTPSSVKEFLQTNVAMAHQLIYEQKLPNFSGTNDEKILKILKWVMANVTYEIDSKRFKVVEKWQDISETLLFKRGDCEDGAVLIFALARVNKISSAQIKLVAGDVKLNTEMTGHCWLEYMPDEFFGTWFTIDWCYWPNVQKFKDRTAKRRGYIKDWFGITDF